LGLKDALLLRRRQRGVRRDCSDVRRHAPFRALLGLATSVNEVSGDLLIWIGCLIRADCLMILFINSWECLRWSPYGGLPLQK